MFMDLKKIHDATAGGEAGLADVFNNGWYPQIIGMARGETDKLAGRTARVFLGGLSHFEIVFGKPGEKVE